MSFAKLIAIGSLFLFTAQPVYGDGLPGEYLLSDKWRQVFANQSPVDNPALIMEEPYLKVRGVLSFSSGDPARLWELGAIMPVNLFNTVGISILGESGSDVEGYLYREADSLIKSGVTRNSNIFFMGSYAINPWGNVSVGTNLNVAYQGNFGDPTWGIGADIGISYRFMLNPNFGYHIVGFSYKNLFSPKMSISRNMPYSAQLKSQYHGSFLKNRLFLDYQLSMSDFNSRSALFIDNKKYDWDMELQVGVSPIPYLKVMAFTDINQWNDLGSFGLVFGVNMPNVNSGKELSFLYQYRQNLHTDLLGNHSLYSSAQLGAHREEIFARRLAQLGKFGINNLYTQAMENYHKKNYWDAYFAFSHLLSDNPDFFKNDAVSYYAASCLENLDMRSAAIQAYRKVKERYPESQFAAQADLGIMRIRYREGKYDEVKQQYREITKDNVSDSIKEHAAYYMGETEVILGNYSQAGSYFEMITEGHSLYPFAQHSLATTSVFLDESNQKIKEHLLNVIDAQQISTEAQREIINRSLMMLGYIYYEEKAMAKAVTALRMIPKESYYYEDAQLGLGWAAVKSRQWADCIVVGEQIHKVSKKEIIQSEGQLLQAYGYLQQKDFSKAEEFLKSATQMMDSYDLTENDRSIKQNHQYEITRSEYDSLASEVARIAQLSSVQMINVNLIELHNKQITLKKSIDFSIRSEDEHKRTRFFERTFLKLREDLEYALVTVLRIRSSKEKKEVFEQKEKKIDRQINELKSKMKELKKK